MSKHDSLENLDGGDLGLGRGLKPGGIPFKPPLDENDSDAEPERGRGIFAPDLATSPRRSIMSIGAVKHERKQLFQRLTNVLRRSKSEDTVMKDEPCHRYADVAFGTSIREQRRLYQSELNGLFTLGLAKDQGDQMALRTQKTEAHNLSDEKNNAKHNFSLMKKFRQAEQEIEYLRMELEKSQKQVEVRYKALRLLKGQSYAIQTQHLDTSKKAKTLNKSLEQEINQLQFELEYRQSTLMTSQEMWAGRFDRVCLENTSLMCTLEKRSEDLRKLQAEKAAVVRERDELLALLDVQERQRYEMTKSQSSDESEYNNFSSTELAVLGACRCRIQSPQPCGCAHAAAYMKREIGSLKESLAKEHQQHNEAVIMADAYRIAFEEQLNRNSSLMHRLVEFVAEPESPSQLKRRSKPSAALRWLIKQLNEEDCLSSSVPSKSPPLPSESGDNGKPPPASPSVENGDPEPPSGSKENVIEDALEKGSEDEVVQIFLEMIKDRSEALAHQRLAARMLANRIKELENKIDNHADEVFEK